jgi:putative hydrolase of the HAD superfamily
MTIKAVLFDVDNTLIDFMERKRLAISESVKAMVDAGIDESYSQLHKDFNDYYWSHGIENQKIFQQFLKDKYGKIDYKVLAYAILAYRRASNGLLRPYPGSKSTLISLRERGFKLAILSDAPRLEAYLRLCAVGLDDFFDVILTKDDVKATKPNKRGFKMVAKKLGILPEECMMVGDNLSRDMAGAKSLGMKTIFAKYGLVLENEENKVLNEKNIDFTAETIKDIPGIVFRAG